MKTFGNYFFCLLPFLVTGCGYISLPAIKEAVIATEQTIEIFHDPENKKAHEHNAIEAALEASADEASELLTYPADYHFNIWDDGKLDINKQESYAF